MQDDIQKPQISYGYSLQSPTHQHKLFLSAETCQNVQYAVSKGYICINRKQHQQTLVIWESWNGCLAKTLSTKYYFHDTDLWIRYIIIFFSMNGYTTWTCSHCKILFPFWFPRPFYCFCLLGWRLAINNQLDIWISLGWKKSKCSSVNTPNYCYLDWGCFDLLNFLAPPLHKIQYLISSSIFFYYYSRTQWEKSYKNAWKVQELLFRMHYYDIQCFSRWYTVTVLCWDRRCSTVLHVYPMQN